MGQRCAILIKKNFKNNVSEINLVHHQWGIGKVLGALFLQELLKSNYNLDRRAEWKEDFMPTKEYFTFSPLSNFDSNYIYNKTVKTTTKAYDIWDSKARMKLLDVCDNNNGGMLIEVTQKYDEQGRAKTYGDCIDVKIGFFLGNEETDFSHNKISGYIEIEKPYERIVSLKEFMARTWETGEEGGSNKMFLQSFNNLCNLFGVEQVVERGKAIKIAKKWLKVQVLADTFTKNVAEHDMIPIPKELQESIQLFK